MAHIKCRYTFPYCSYCGERVWHDEYWYCDGPDGGCVGKYTRPKNEDPKVFNPTCVYCRYEIGEFEKTVRNYEYEYGRLTIGNRVYEEAEIKYLEIDGRKIANYDE